LGIDCGAVLFDFAGAAARFTFRAAREAWSVDRAGVFWPLRLAAEARPESREDAPREDLEAGFFEAGFLETCFSEACLVCF
jgi:hypothetical protein